MTRTIIYHIHGLFYASISGTDTLINCTFHTGYSYVFVYVEYIESSVSEFLWCTCFRENMRIVWDVQPRIHPELWWFWCNCNVVLRNNLLPTSGELWLLLNSTLRTSIFNLQPYWIYCARLFSLKTHTSMNKWIFAVLENNRNDLYNNYSSGRTYTKTIVWVFDDERIRSKIIKMHYFNFKRNYERVGTYRSEISHLNKTKNNNKYI